jgi:hypothetical protein
MEQRKTALLTVKTEELNFFLIVYDGLEDLSQEIFNLSVDRDFHLKPVTVTLPSGKNYEWDYWMAHYCFAKGRLSDSDFVAHIFNDEPEEAVAL